MKPSKYVFGIDGYITANINADEWLDAFLEWIESHSWQFGGITGEIENAALRAELMSLKGAYYSANNKGWQLEFDNAALKEETERLRDGIRDVRKHIAPMHTAYDMLLILLAQEKGEDDE